MRTKTYNIFYALLLLGSFLVAASSVSALWQGPSQAPPGGNVAAPINVGNNSQIKEGNLTLNVSNSFLNGLLVPYGNVGIGTINPQGKLEIISGGCYYRFTSTAYDSNCPYIVDPAELNLVVASDTANYNIATALENPTTAKNVILTINSGVTVYSTSTGSPSLDTGTLPSGSTITIVNNGSIIGAGGSGGTGNSGTGGTGGNAISLSTSVSLNNTNGNIFGGGAGGGGGGIGQWINLGGCADGQGIDSYGGGGGGGGFGSASGAGGAGASGNACSGTNGQVGPPGTGGAGCSSSDTYSGSGGNGGDYGQPGSQGNPGLTVDACGSSWVNPGGAGGAPPGKAINTNSNIITWLGGNNGTQVKGAVQ